MAPPPPVRLARRLTVAAIALISAQTIAAAALFARFGAAVTTHGPWNVGEQTQLDSMHMRLALTAVLGAGLVGLLAGVALAIPRRSVGTRTVVGLASLLTTVGLLLGVVINPDNALLASGAAEEAHLYRVLPLWFSVLSSTAVAGALFSLAAAFITLGREAAFEYYQYRDPATRWHGFESWQEIARER